MEYKITINTFSGPLDLLIHLIKQSEMDILDINISEIADQYLLYISSMKTLNLDIDSEYLVMAADLMEIKSKELLPNEEIEGEEEDPKENLINRLIEYQKYKEISTTFENLETERHKLFTPPISNPLDYTSQKFDPGITLDDLIKALRKFNEKKDLEKPLRTVVTRKEYSVDKRSEEIMNKLNKHNKIAFEDLFDITTPDYVVVSFLAILDLAKKEKIIINQDYNLDKITLSRRNNQ